MFYISLILLIFALFSFVSAGYFYYIMTKSNDMNSKIIENLGKENISIKKEFEQKKTELEKQIADFEESKKETEEEEQKIISDLTEQIKSIDNDINQKYNELYEKNSVIFDCPCNHNSIRTFIDLSKEENTFVCPECKNEYRVDIRMIPILKGKIIDEHNMFRLLSEATLKIGGKQ